MHVKLGLVLSTESSLLDSLTAHLKCRVVSCKLNLITIFHESVTQKVGTKDTSRCITWRCCTYFKDFCPPKRNENNTNVQINMAELHQVLLSFTFYVSYFWLAQYFICWHLQRWFERQLLCSWGETTTDHSHSLSVVMAKDKGLLRGKFADISQRDCGSLLCLI